MENRYDRGLARRREVLGEGHTNRLTATTEKDPFLGPMFDLVTEFAWGGTWAREGLSTKHRCMVTVAMLVALNRPEELEVHIRGALRNQLTQDELREMLLHAATYCGWPAAIGAFRIAKRVIDELARQETADRP
jgi:4-carboxymuconolactone decarboxylase